VGAGNLSLPNAFKIYSGDIDDAYLGFNDIIAINLQANTNWDKQIWDDLAAGIAIQDAVRDANQRLGGVVDANFHLSTTIMSVIGDPSTKLHGVYTGAGTAWHTP